MQLNWADIFWSVAPILKVKKLSQMQHLPTKKNVIINHYLIQFRFSKEAKNIWKYLPNDFHIKFQIYSEIFLQLLCWLLRKKMNFITAGSCSRDPNPSYFDFPNHEITNFNFFYCLLLYCTMKGVPHEGSRKYPYIFG